jgi:Fe-S cluster assembly scaffold protein SufB
MKYPAVWLMEEGAHGEVLSIAFAGKGQHLDAGAKIVHAAPRTTSLITSKSICKDGGRGGYRGLVRVENGAEGVKSFVRCDALILDDKSRSDTYPYMEIEEADAQIGHEATVSKVGDDQLFYLMSRGLTEPEATAMIVAGSPSRSSRAADGVRRRAQPADRAADGRERRVGGLRPPFRPRSRVPPASRREPTDRIARSGP